MISSIKGELLPYLVKKQFSNKQNNVTQNETLGAPLECDSFNQTNNQNDNENIDEMDFTSWNDHKGDLKGAYHGRKIKCYLHVVDAKNSICDRANNLHSYCDLNRQDRILSLLSGYDANKSKVHSEAQVDPKAALGPECFVAEGAKISEKTTTKGTSVGPNSCIEQKVRVTNCILMENVVIKEGCQISGSVICPGAVIPERCVIKDCIVGKSFKLAQGGNLLINVHKSLKGSYLFIKFAAKHSNEIFSGTTRSNDGILMDIFNTSFIIAV